MRQIKMKIRKAFINDAKKIAEIKYYTWLDAYKDILGKELIESNMDLNEQAKKIESQIRLSFFCYFAKNLIKKLYLL